jgi:hypothetical protein
MIYHSLKLDSEPKIIGVRDGISQVQILPEGFSNRKSYERLEKFFEPRIFWERLNHKPPQSFVVEHAKLKHNARFTDFMSFSPFFMACPFMLSKKAKELFANFCIQKSYMLKTIIYDNQSLVNQDYSLLYMPYLGYECINFAKSRFVVRGELRTFTSQEDYEAFCNKEHRIPSVESLVLSENFDSELDFFQCRIGPMFMSERLINEVKLMNLSGIVFPTKNNASAYAI